MGHLTVAVVSIEAFFAANYPVIRSKCARMLGDGDEAADVAQETFLRLWQSGAADADLPQRMSWIYKTSTRLAIDQLPVGIGHQQKLGIEGNVLYGKDGCGP